MNPIIGSDLTEPADQGVTQVKMGQKEAKKKPARGGFILEDGGAARSRTEDPLLAKQVLYQLSYSPT